MTSHELARMLLAAEDVLVVTETHSDCGNGYSDICGFTAIDRLRLSNSKDCWCGGSYHTNYEAIGHETVKAICIS